MNYYAVLFVLSCALSLIMTPIVRLLVTKAGIFDKPNKRKVYKGEVFDKTGFACFSS